MDEVMLQNVHRLISGHQVSPAFECIARTLGSSFWHDDLREPYKPSLGDIQYLVDRVIRQYTNYLLHLTNIKLTVYTGSYLGYLLNSCQVREIHIGNIGDGELALARSFKGFVEYNFSRCRMGFERIESFVNALDKSFHSLNFNYNDIPVDGLKIILRGFKENLKKSDKFNYCLKWNQSFDINQLGLDELLDYVEHYEFTVHNFDDDNQIKIGNTSNVNSFLKIQIGCNKSMTGDIKRFLNQNKNKNWTVRVDEHETECLLLMSMIDIFKELSLIFQINCSTETFIGHKKLNEIMESLVETSLIDLTININHLTSEGFKIIIDKIKNMKLQRLSLGKMKLIDFNSQTVVEPFGFPGLQCLSIDNCKLNYELTQKLFNQLEHSRLEKFSISSVNLRFTFGCKISMSLICCNLTSLELIYCKLCCGHVRIIAESLKNNTKIKSINLAGNSIEDDGVEAIANVVGQTRLNSLILDYNLFKKNGDIHLLKSIKETKITICGINSLYCNERKYEAIASVLKDNKILLKCIEKGKNDKIDEYLERNNNSLDKAKLIIDKYQKDSLSYQYKYKDYFEAYELFSDTDILWTNFNDKKLIKLRLKNKIKDNYMKICGVIKDKLEVNDENWGNEKNISDLSPETMNVVCSNLCLSDVRS